MEVRMDWKWIFKKLNIGVKFRYGNVLFLKFEENWLNNFWEIFYIKILRKN